MKSFKELEEATSVSPKLLQTTLEEYVTTGSSIVAIAVIKIAEKVQPDAKAINKLIETAQLGVDRQTVLGQPKDANEYKNLIVHLQNRLPLA